MKSLRISSCMAPLMDPMVQALADQLARDGLSVEFVSQMSWREREQAFDHGEIDLLWICGLPYVQRMDRPDQSVRLLAAPVMAAERYQKKPVYYSDVLVKNDTDYRTFDDLLGARWAFNEPNSQSGFNVTRWHLARLGLTWDFFGSVRAAGSHEAALKLLLADEIDAAAIDSTVWELVVRQEPALLHQLRVIETLGPSPIPPWLARGGLAPAIFDQAQQRYLRLDNTPEGKAALGMAGIEMMVKVTDRDYDPIRRMDRQAQQVTAVEWIMD